MMCWMSYSSYEAGSRLHRAEARVSDLHSQDLGSGSDSVTLRFIGEVTRCDAGHMRPMSSCKHTLISVKPLNDTRMYLICLKWQFRTGQY